VKSVGGVFIRDSEFDSLIHRGKQEWDLRAGTENLAGLASMIAAVKKSIEVLDMESKRLNAFRKLIISRLKNVPKILFNSAENSAPGILSISFSDITGSEIVGALSLGGIAVSKGSACHASEAEPSRVILAMGRNTSEAKGSVRISMGRGTTKQAVNDLIDALLEIVMK